jgi:hypothetical protein
MIGVRISSELINKKGALASAFCAKFIDDVRRRDASVEVRH